MKLYLILDIIRAMREQRIIEDEEIPFCLMLEETLKLREAEAGVLALFFSNIRDEYIAEIAEKTIYAYYMLPEKIRKMKSKRSIVESVLKDNDIDVEYSISTEEMCETLIQAYIDNIFEVAIEEQKNEENERREYISDYVDDSMNLLILLCDMVGTWEAKNGELNTNKSRKEYAEFMNSLIDNLDRNSYIGSSIITNLNNMTFFAQNIFSKYNDLRICEVTDNDINAFIDCFPFVLEGKYEEREISQKVNRNVAVELPIYDIETYISGTKYQTVTGYFLEFLNNMFDNPELGRTKQLYSLKTMDTLAGDFPDFLDCIST